MKTLLLILIMIIGITLILGLPIDSIQSNLPSWKGMKIPEFVRFIVIALFNIGLPILFFIKLKNNVKPQIIVGYLLLINSLYLLLNFWPENFVKDKSIDYEAYSNYASSIVGIFITILSVHLLFYIYSLLKLVQKASANSRLAQ